MASFYFLLRMAIIVCGRLMLIRHGHTFFQPVAGNGKRHIECKRAASSNTSVVLSGFSC